MESLYLEILPPLVAQLLDAHHHPLGFTNFTLARLLQPENAELPMLVTLSGIVILSKLLQPENAELPMLVTLSGISILVRLLQLWNSPLPIHVTPLGILMLVRLLQ